MQKYKIFLFQQIIQKIYATDKHDINLLILVNNNLTYRVNELKMFIFAFVFKQQYQE